MMQDVSCRMSYLAVSFQLILQPLEVAVSSSDTRVLQFKNGKICLDCNGESIISHMILYIYICGVSYKMQGILEYT